RRQIKAEEQAGERALATAGGPDQGDAGARLDREIEILEHRCMHARVSETEVLNFDAACALVRMAWPQRVRLGRRIHQVADASHRNRGLLELLPQSCEP